MNKAKTKKCQSCRRSAPDVRFATLAASGRPDSLCVTCRFDKIDARYASPRAIQRDMEAAGIPLAGVGARRLATGRLEPTRHSPSKSESDDEDASE